MSFFCKDCKWSTDRQADYRFWKCVAPQNISTDVVNPVTGEKGTKRRYIYCDTLRTTCGDESCGPDGDWFVAREQKDKAA